MKMICTAQRHSIGIWETLLLTTPCHSALPRIALTSRAVSQKKLDA